MKDLFNREILDSGLEVVSLSIPNRYSTAFGIWSKAGARHDPLGLDGLAHFSEHMFFKGTTNRTNRQISDEMEAVGGSMNAFTTYDVISIHGRTLGKDLNVATDIIGDMVRNPLFSEIEIEKEKQVVAEEIAQDLDDPISIGFTRLTEIMWDSNPLAHNILGSHESVNGFTRQNIIDFHQKHYQPGNLIAAACGEVDHRAFIDEMQRIFDGAEGRNHLTAPTSKPANTGSLHLQQDDIGQAYVYLVMPANDMPFDKKYALSMLSMILGGSTSSRLFQKIREDRGMAYSVGASTEFFEDNRLLMASANVHPKNADSVFGMILDEIMDIAHNGVRDDEFYLARKHIPARLMLSSESTNGMLYRTVTNLILFNEFVSIDDTARGFAEVTKDDLREAAEMLSHKDNMIGFIYGGIDGDFDGKGLDIKWHKPMKQ